MIFYQIGYRNYNICCKIHNENVLVATVRSQLIEVDEVYLTMYFPYMNSSEKTIKVTWLTEDELLEKVRRIIVKNLYKISDDILQGIKTVEFNDEKYKRRHCIVGEFCPGDVYVER